MFKAETDTLLYKLTSIYNTDNDYKTSLITGIQAEDSLSPWLLDSFFYNVGQFDTIQLNYIFEKGEWKKNQIFKKKYDSRNNLIYFYSQRFRNREFKMEKFMKYKEENRVVLITLYECNVMKNGCDSSFKEIYTYQGDGSVETRKVLY